MITRCFLALSLCLAVLCGSQAGANPKKRGGGLLFSLTAGDPSIYLGWASSSRDFDLVDIPNGLRLLSVNTSSGKFTGLYDDLAFIIPVSGKVTRDGKVTFSGHVVDGAGDSEKISFAGRLARNGSSIVGTYSETFKISGSKGSDAGSIYVRNDTL
jgi:hypothetical protein